MSTGITIAQEGNVNIVQKKKIFQDARKRKKNSFFLRGEEAKQLSLGQLFVS